MSAQFEHHYLDSFLEMLAAERGASKHTLSSYALDLKDFLSFVQAPLHATRHQVEAYLQCLSQKGLKASTLARRLSAIRQYYYFLLIDKHIEQDPTQGIDLPKKPQRLPKILSLDEVDQLLSVSAQDKTPEGLRLNALLETLYATGLRVSELVTLPLATLRINTATQTLAPTLIVLGKGKKERLVPLTPAAQKSLFDYLAVRSLFVKNLTAQKYLFPSYGKEGHLTRQRLCQLLKDLALKANLTPEKISPHVIRHAFATHLLQNGADLLVIQKLLGHADISTTQVYTHVVSDHLTELVLNHHPLAKKS